MIASRLPTTIEWNGKCYGINRGGYYYSGKTMLHRDIWELHNGPIPKGFVIHHKDKNRLNNNLSNLELVERGQHSVNHWKEKLPLIEVEGLRLTPPEWMRLKGFGKDTIQSRMRKGWPPEKAVTRPVPKRKT